MNCTTVLFLVVYLLTNSCSCFCLFLSYMVYIPCPYLPFQQLLSCHVQYDSHSITSSKLLKEAVKESSYPPSITCVVTYNEELRSTGRPTEVGLHISGMDPKMEFQCTAYERIQGDWNRLSDCPNMVIL